MVDVFVGVGSNVDRERNLRGGITALRAAFGELAVSSVWDSKAVGFDGPDFLNLVVSFRTDLPVRAVADALDAIEERFGRSRSEKGKLVSRSLDLDLLLYGDQCLSGVDVAVPRPDILKYAFVLAPLAEIAPDRRHPVDGRSYGELWRAFAGDARRLQRVPLDVTG